MSVEDEEQLTEAPVAALHNNGNNNKSAKHTGTILIVPLNATRGYSCYICY